MREGPGREWPGREGCRERGREKGHGDRSQELRFPVMAVNKI